MIYADMLQGFELRRIFYVSVVMSRSRRVCNQVFSFHSLAGVYIEFFLMSGGRCSSPSKVVVEPRHMAVAEGNMRVFIPCPFGGSITPYWKINATFYYHSRLPRPFIATTKPRGLIIETIDRYLDGICLQCFVASGSSSDARALASPKTMIDVGFVSDKYVGTL